MSVEALRKFADKKQEEAGIIPFLTLKENEEVVFKPVDAEEVESPFNKDETGNEYTVEIEGKQKTFFTGSGVFARQFAEAMERSNEELKLTKKLIKTKFGKKLMWQIIFKEEGVEVEF
jgi:hypothetical protein